MLYICGGNGGSKVFAKLTVDTTADEDWFTMYLFCFLHRPLADGTVPCAVPAAPPMKYVLGYRSRTLNPNPVTDPNPNPKNNKKRKRHRNEIEELYLKVDFLGTGVSL